MMKKITALLTLASLVFGPASALAINDATATPINTGFTVAGSGEENSGDTPIIKAVWEEEDDDTTTTETQIIPQGDCGTMETVHICAVIEDDTFYKGESTTNVDNEVDVLSRLYYDKRPGMSTDDANVLVTNLSTDLDKLNMDSLAQDDGVAAFCNGAPASNPTIVTYYEQSAEVDYDYYDICGNNDPDTSDGQLYKGTAKVFCGDFNLSFEAAAGDYEVLVKAMDSDSLYDETERNTNWFTYVPVLAYELDFANVNYGNISTDEWDYDRDGNNIGDAKWGYSDDSNDPVHTLRPTVRNLGNVEFKMTVDQGDMVNNTLGSTLYGYPLENVSYRARVGNADWSNVYYPSTSARTLNDKVALSQYLEMDFAIMTTDGMQIGDEYTGDMTLDALYQAFAETPTSIHTDYTCEHVGGDFDIDDPSCSD